MKTLKEIKICLTNLNIELSKYLEKNIGVEKLSIFWNKNINCCKLNNLQKFFPNISLLFVQISAKDKVQKAKLEIKEESNCKINNFEIEYFGGYLTFNCQSYEKLKSVKFKFCENMKSYKVLDDSILINCFPIFSDKSNIIFNCLTNFELILFSCSKKFLNNFYKNIDNLANLREFKFHFNSFLENENFYNNFFKKIMSLKLIEKVDIIKFNDENKNNLYSKNELNNIFPNKNLIDFDEIYISKYNKSFNQYYSSAFFGYSKK